MGANLTTALKRRASPEHPCMDAMSHAETTYNWISTSINPRVIDEKTDTAFLICNFLVAF
jgi:hypothetical protein